MTLGSLLPEHRQDDRDDGSKKPPLMSEDLADVVAAAAEDGEEGVAEGAFQVAAGKATVGLHVTDLGLDAAAPSERLRQRRGQPAAGAADQDLGAMDAVTLVAAIDDSPLRRVAGENADLLQRLAEGVAVVRVPRQRARAHHEAALQRGGHADLGAELVAHPSLSLRDAVDLRLMERVDLARVLRRLVEQPRDHHELVEHPLAQRPLGDLVKLPPDVPHHAAGITLERSQCLAHAPELFRMRVATDLRRQTRCETRVALPQLDPGVSGQIHQLRPCAFVEPGVRRVRNVLFHDSRIDGDLIQACVLEDPRLPPGLDGLRQQPFGTLFSDPLPPAGQRRGSIGGSC